jgi:hypothetical protein
MNVLCANYQTVRSFVDRFKKRCRETDQDDVGIICEYPSPDFSAMVDALVPNLQPSFQTEKLSEPVTGKICQSTTISAPNVAELLRLSSPSIFTRGAAAEVVNAGALAPNSFEIPITKLCPAPIGDLCVCIPFNSLLHGKTLELRPYKLVIHQVGEHPHAHRDSMRSELSFGTLVLILNSKYTGGELEITHNGQTEVVTGPYSWVAMYGDCLHKINPVTSGTRVSLIFDIVIDWKTPQQPLKFWYRDYYPHSTNEMQAAAAPVMNAQQKAALTKALTHEFATLTTLLIALDQLYDATAVLPAALQGSDLTLYNALQEDFELSVSYCAVHHMASFGNSPHGNSLGAKVSAELLTTFEKGDLDVYGPMPAKPIGQVGKIKASKRRPVRPDWARTKLVLPRPPRLHHVVDYVGAPAEESYVVSCLQVRAK